MYRSNYHRYEVCPYRECALSRLVAITLYLMFCRKMKYELSLMLQRSTSSTDGHTKMECKSLPDQPLHVQLPVHAFHGNVLLDTPFGNIVNTAETPQSLTSYIKGRSAAVWREISGLQSPRQKKIRTRRHHPQNSIQLLPLIWTVLVIITFIAVHHKHGIARDTLTTCEFALA